MPRSRPQLGRPALFSVPEPAAPAVPPQRVAVVTGAARGIGAHLASAFAASGYAVAGCSATGRVQGPAGTTSSRAALVPTPTVAAVDVTDERAVADFVDRVLAEHGRIDVLVNNAGVMDAEVPLEASDPADWWRAVEVNVRGPYLLTRAVLPVMLAAGSGRIVNLSSGAATRPGEVSTAYNVGKTALTRLTGSTHATGWARGVRAFDLSPGVVRTDMTLGMRVHDERTEWTSPEDVTELALVLAAGELDAFSGRFVRAGSDTPAALRAMAAAGLAPQARTIGLLPYGDADPLT